MKKVFIVLSFILMGSICMASCQATVEKEKAPKVSVTIGYDEALKEEIFAGMGEKEREDLLFAMTDKLSKEVKEAKGEEEIRAVIAQAEEDLNLKTKEPVKTGTRRFIILARKDGKDYSNQEVVTKSLEE